LRSRDNITLHRGKGLYFIHATKEKRIREIVHVTKKLPHMVRILRRELYYKAKQKEAQCLIVEGYPKAVYGKTVCTV
tara:strand:- start:6 stop:236 length:231 start_codon:yes stop_codon:yes gene_type:complete